MFKLNRRTQAIGLLLSASLIWGSSFILIKRGLEVYSVEQVGLLRILFAYIVLLPGAILKLKKYLKTSGLALFISGIIGNFIPAFLFAKAQTQLDSGITGVLNSLTPLFTLIIGIALFHQHLQKRQLYGIFLGLLGTIGLSVIGKDGAIGEINYYVFFVIFAAICYGFNVNFVKKYLSNVPATHVTGFALFFIGPPSLIYLFLTDFVTRTTQTAGAWEALGYLAILGIINTAFALILFFKLLKITSAVVASSVTYIIPVVALILGFFDNEMFFISHLFGMLLIFFGVYLVNKK